MTQIIVAALYHFAPLPDFRDRREPLPALCDAQDIKGTLLLAEEGVNGTIAGRREAIDLVLGHLRAFPGCAGMEHKESFAETMPFYRMKVRLKKEIVTMGVPGVDPNALVGTYVEPEDWNDLISREDVVVIDTRNDYEVRIGSFRGAVDPQTKSFREFPEWFENFQRTHNKPKVAMFCTGGIRCEKSTAFAKSTGLEDVYHLKGGILKYLERIPEDQSLWQGECFVFDQRVSVKHGLEEGGYDLCFACRQPISDEDKASAQFVEGICCPHCVDVFSDKDRKRFEERQRQIALAKGRGNDHIGQDLDRARETADLQAEEHRRRSIAGGDTAKSDSQ